MLKSEVSSNESMNGPTRVGIVTHLLLLGIGVYRCTLSPIFGGGCRFYPSCSVYAEQALRRYGALRGSMLAAKRVLRCHPWHEPGYDPVE